MSSERTRTNSHICMFELFGDKSAASSACFTISSGMSCSVSNTLYDLLDPGIRAEDIVARLERLVFRRRSLGVLYLDQGFMAGLGNYLRSEILFCAGVAPERRPCDLERETLLRLAETTLDLGWRSYHTRGVTLDDETCSRLPRGGRRKRCWVVARAGQRCYRCKSSIRKEIRGGRRLYRCSSCQC